MHLIDIVIGLRHPLLYSKNAPIAPGASGKDGELPSESAIRYRPYYKIMTMVPDADASERKRFSQGIDAVTGKTNIEDLIIPGRGWLRKGNLDELPQALHILKGEMALGGIRPHSDAEWDGYFTNAKFDTYDELSDDENKEYEPWRECINASDKYSLNMSPRVWKKYCSELKLRTIRHTSGWAPAFYAGEDVRERNEIGIPAYLVMKLELYLTAMEATEKIEKARARNDEKAVEKYSHIIRTTLKNWLPALETARTRERVGEILFTDVWRTKVARRNIKTK
jgi:hypothetical protein